MFRPLLIALQFLTRIPVPMTSSPEACDMGRSLLFYPLVGLILGLLLILIAELSQGLNVFLSAALIVSVWVIFSGGLHLDGLSDTVDAWIGGMGSKERTLAIMKDPTAGPMGVLSLVLCILLKTAGIYALLLNCPTYYLLLPPVLGRTMAIMLLAITPYVRENGVGSVLSKELNTGALTLVSVLVGVLLVLITSVWNIGLILLCLCLLLLWRYQLMKRISGCTGDTIGALLEMTETLTLIAMVFLYQG